MRPEITQHQSRTIRPENERSLRMFRRAEALAASASGILPAAKPVLSGPALSQSDSNAAINRHWFRWQTLLNGRSLPIIAMFTEWLLLTFVTFQAGNIYHIHTHGILPSSDFYVLATIALTAFFVLSCGFIRDYSLSRLLRRRDQLRSVFLHWNSAYLVFTFTLFISYATDFYSRGFILAQYIVGLLAAIGTRLLLSAFVNRSVRAGLISGKRVVILGNHHSLTSIIKLLRSDAHGIEIIGCVKFSASAQDGNRSLAPEQIEDIVNAITEIGRKQIVDAIIIAMPVSRSQDIKELVRRLGILPATVHLVPDAAGSWIHRYSGSTIGALKTFHLLRAPFTLKDQILKRTFDLFVATLLLAMILPGFLIIAALIKLDSRGPVFFRQRRHGFNEGEFRIIKFRTMTTMDDGAKVRQASRDDIRITRIGRFLRRTNLDELPQLLNVIAGNMSLVGPRPHALAHNNEFNNKIQFYAKRHNVKPGITGWSQVNGYRGETDTIDKMINRVEFDLFYINNWSIFLDIKILFNTVFSRKSYENAY